jgi:hypothetical protein
MTGSGVEVTIERSLSSEVIAAVHESAICEFATVTKAGVPIDTPLLCFARSKGLVEVTTGLAYPAKANRARRNPKVGLMFEPSTNPFDPGSGPTVLMAAGASVRDADIAENTRRYVDEPLARLASGATDWEAGRSAIWYFARIWIQCAPLRVWWWEGPGVPDRLYEWRAPKDTVVPPSDPKPSTTTTRSDWPIADVSQRADAVIASGTMPHLTVVDRDGWPLPMRCLDVARTHSGFDLTLPQWTPWSHDGPACLAFAPAAATFLGTVQLEGDRGTFHIERLLPDLPMVQDPAQVMNPHSSTKEELLRRLEVELAARNAPVPELPDSLDSA